MHLILCNDALGCHAYTDWLRDQGLDQEADYLMEIFQQGESGFSSGCSSGSGYGHGSGFGYSYDDGNGFGFGYDSGVNCGFGGGFGDGDDYGYGYGNGRGDGIRDGNDSNT